MRVVLSVAFLFAFAAVLARADEPKSDLPIPQDKWDLSYLEKQWNVTLKSVKCNKKGTGEAGYFELLLEFTKDTSDVQGLVSTMIESRGSGAGSASGVLGGKPVFHLCVFDSDNVMIQKVTQIGLSAGEISGKQGDAFRVVFVINSDALGKAAKVQARPLESTPKSSASK